jgi:hypothetical protein
MKQKTEEYCTFNFDKKFENEIAIGWFQSTPTYKNENEVTLHSLIPWEELLFKALEFARRREMDDAKKPGDYQHQVHKHFLVEGYAIPITFYMGLVIFVKRSKSALYLCSVK